VLLTLSRSPAKTKRGKFDIKEENRKKIGKKWSLADACRPKKKREIRRQAFLTQGMLPAPFGVNIY